MTIRTALDQPGVKRDGNYRTHISRLMFERGCAIPTFAVDKDAPPAMAYVIRGGWAANCPSCPGAIVVEPGEPYFCPDCGNAAIGGKARRLVWPTNRKAIEAVLDLRTDPMTKNWVVGETVADLKRENREHKLAEE